MPVFTALHVLLAETIFFQQANANEWANVPIDLFTRWIVRR